MGSTSDNVSDHWRDPAPGQEHKTCRGGFATGGLNFNTLRAIN